jgi:predicted nucleic acid-binding Zn ribbon protein
MRKSNEQTLKEVLNDLLKAYKLDKGIGELRVAKAWETQLGVTINKHTKEFHLRDGILTVSLDSSVVREELMYAKTKIKEMLNKEAGTEVIKDIIFR